MAEFVIVIVPFLLLLLGIIQLSLIAVAKSSVKFAASRAARAAVVVLPAYMESDLGNPAAPGTGPQGEPPLILVVRRLGENSLEFVSFDGSLDSNESIVEFDRMPDKVFIGKDQEVKVGEQTVKADGDGFVDKQALRPLAKPFQVDRPPPVRATNSYKDDPFWLENVANPLLAIRKAAAFALFPSAPAVPGEFVGEALFGRGDLRDKEEYALQASGVVLTNPGGIQPKWNGPVTARVVYLYYCQIPLINRFMCDEVEDLPEDARADMAAAGVSVPGPGRFILLRAEQTLINQGRPPGGNP
jgi:hypothetical protein